MTGWSTFLIRKGDQKRVVFDERLYQKGDTKVLLDLHGNHKVFLRKYLYKI